jgi:hypothetical protein
MVVDLFWNYRMSRCLFILLLTSALPNPLMSLAAVRCAKFLSFALCKRVSWRDV